MKKESPDNIDYFTASLEVRLEDVLLYCMSKLMIPWTGEEQVVHICAKLVHSNCAVTPMSPHRLLHMLRTVGHGLPYPRF